MKNISKFILLISVAIFAVVSFNYINKSGFFEKYPDAVYMDENSAAGRIAYSQLNNKEKAVYILEQALVGFENSKVDKNSNVCL